MRFEFKIATNHKFNSRKMSIVIVHHLLFMEVLIKKSKSFQKKTQYSKVELWTLQNKQKVKLEKSQKKKNPNKNKCSKSKIVWQFKSRSRRSNRFSNKLKIQLPIKFLLWWSISFWPTLYAQLSRSKKSFYINFLVASNSLQHLYTMDQSMAGEQRTSTIDRTREAPPSLCSK